MNKIFFAAFLLSSLAVTSAPAAAQDAVPGGMLMRTVNIAVGKEAGTGFTVDHNGKLYLVTARHVVADLPSNGGTIQIRQNNQWRDLRYARIMYPKSKDVDIAVIDTNEKAASPFPIRPIDDKNHGITFGQQVWFIGYPYGLGSHLKSDKGAIDIPFIKKGTMSAIDSSNPEAVLLYIDGFNNPGFSGGPIIYWEFGTRTYKILGVVKGYQPEPTKTLVNGKYVDTEILTNSGILLGYSITHALDAIDGK